MATCLALLTSKIVKWNLQLSQEKISQASRYKKRRCNLVNVHVLKKAWLTLLHLYLILSTITRGMHIYFGLMLEVIELWILSFWHPYTEAKPTTQSTGGFNSVATFCNSWVHFPETWKYEATETTSVISILISTNVFVTALKARLALCPTHYWVMRLILHSACSLTQGPDWDPLIAFSPSVVVRLFSLFKWPSYFITRQLYSI